MRQSANINEMEKMKNITFKLTTLATAAFLTACGGGGDDDTATISPVIKQSVPLITEIAVPTYSLASGELAAFNYLNAERASCGFGKVAQSTALDAAGKNHARYYSANRVTSVNSPHHETRGLIGFTGVSPEDRALAVGYTSTVLEVGAFANNWRNLEYIGQYDSSVIAYNSVRTLMAAPYHALHVFSSAVEVGFGTHKDEKLANGIQELDAATFFEFGYGNTSAGQLPPTGADIRTYPCEGTRNILPEFPGEWTGGAPVEGDRNISFNPLGHPIMVVGEFGKILTLTSASITQVSTGADVGIYVMRMKANDPNPNLMTNDWSGYVFPNQKFVSGQQYRATIHGTSGGVAFNKTFAFWAGQPEDKQETFR